MRLHALLLLLGSLAVQFKISYQTALPACDIKYIQGAKPAEITYVNNVLKCNGPNQIEFKSARYDSLKCDKTKGWTTVDNKVLNVKSNANLNIKCEVDVCKAPILTNLKGTGHTYDTGSRKLTCPGGSIYIKSHPKALYAWISCNNDGWKDSLGLLNPPALPTQPLVYKCITHCDESLIIGKKAEISYVNKKLKCKDDHKILKYKDASKADKEERQHIICNPKGRWGNADVSSANDLEVVGCIDPPACDEKWINKNSAEVAYAPGPPITLECPSGKKLRIDDKMYAKLECDSTGWKGDGVKVKESNEKFDATCVTACKNIKGDLTSDAKEEPPGLFKCNELGIGADKNGIKLDGKFVGSHLHCNEQDGWHDVDKTKIADAFKEVEITCEKLPCKESVRSTCANMGLSKVKLDDYYCDESSNGARWPVEDDDPNFLKCRSKKTMFEIDRLQKFLVKSPKCKNTDNKWLIYDDNNNNAIEEVKPNVLCIQKRCNMCPKFNDPGSSVVFTEGTADECALAKCTNDLWSIKKEGAPSHEQYAGEVTCSSVKGKEGKWVIDGETPIDEGSCIPEATLATCTEASKLVTTCTTAWKADFGCVDITTLADDTEFTCQTGSLFYMQRVDSGFQEGASNIKCDTAKGTWTITKSGGETVVLKRGGTIVCATSNPKPTTTTLAPTTTTKYENPCDVCYENNTSIHLFKCPTCSDKPSDVIATVAGEMCRATHHDKMDLVTENAGSVKEIECSKSDKVWKTKDGKEVGKFAAFLSAEKEPEGQMGLVVGGAIGGVVLLIIVFAVIFKVFIAKKEPDSKEEETRRKKLEETRRKKQKAGDNDEILDGVSVDAPSELKL